METSSFWSCHVWLAAASPHKLKWNWCGKGGKPFLSQGWPHAGQEILSWQCQGPSLHHTEGHHYPIQHSKCACQFQCQRSLYVGPCAHGTNGRSPVAYSSSTNGDLWRITSGVFQGTYLSAQLECPYHGNSHKGCGWAGCPCQPSATSSPPNQESNHKPQKGWVLEALDLQGLKESPKSEQKQARELLLKWEHLFACSDLDLGKSALIKHKIKVIDQTPFKECSLPPYMYDDMRAHIQQMLDIGAIQKSHSPWASTLVLLHKKNGSLRFCINLRKLNNWTIKDAYSPPHIDETLYSLQGSQWLSSLDLKSGYWQVEMGEESKPLTTFTVGLVGFYECERMPFGLTNIPTTFQRLMETCLGTSISTGVSST